MEQTTQTQTQTQNLLDIPHADELIRPTAETEQVMSQQAYNDQVALVTSKVRELSSENQVVTFNLDYPLHEDLVQALYEKGYSVDYSSSVRYVNGTVTRKHTVSIGLSSQQGQRTEPVLSLWDLFDSYLTFPRYQRFPRCPVRPTWGRYSLM